MGRKRAILGTIGDQGVQPVLAELCGQKWTGVLRLRKESRIGAIWLVNGSIVHALLIAGKLRTEGPTALRAAATWNGASVMHEAGALPPARTIREPMDILLSAMRAEAPAGTQPAAGAERIPDTELEDVLETLRARVPGLESLSVTRGAAMEATTTRDLAELQRLDATLQEHYGAEGYEPETMYVQQGGHSILILRSGSLAAILSARTGTAPEALFWAGGEARRRMLSIMAGSQNKRNERDA